MARFPRLPRAERRALLRDLLNTQEAYSALEARYKSERQDHDVASRELGRAHTVVKSAVIQQRRLVGGVQQSKDQRARREADIESMREEKANCEGKLPARSICRPQETVAESNSRPMLAHMHGKVEVRRVHSQRAPGVRNQEYSAREPTMTKCRLRSPMRQLQEEIARSETEMASPEEASSGSRRGLHSRSTYARTWARLSTLETRSGRSTTNRSQRRPAT